MMHWASRYIGRKGMDCWELVRVVYQHEFGITLPIIPGISQANALTRCSTIQRESERDWTEIAAPEEGYAVAMSQQEAMHHVGLWVPSHGGLIVHSWLYLHPYPHQKIIADSRLGLRFKGFKTIKFYRHREWTPNHIQPGSSRHPTLLNLSR